jgi:serine/threonine-protein kinase
MPEAQSGASEGDLIGRIIADKIELTDLIGEGAMGSVYRAHHRPLDKIVAVKVLKHPFGDDAASRAARFEVEARAASRLDHPNSVRILDFGMEKDDALFYLVMEYLAGRTMRAIIAEEQFISAPRTCRLMAEVLSALDAAHGLQILHRDIKPANIMIVPRRAEDGTFREQAKVCDFGLAKLTTGDPRDAVTLMGSVLGTPAYMAPEQVLGGDLDPRTDIFACGVTMYFAISGRLPLPSSKGDDREIALKRLVEQAAPLSRFVPEIDPEVETLVLKAMNPDPDKRFVSALGMRRAIDAVLERYAERSSSSGMNESTETVRVSQTMSLNAPARPRKSRWLAWVVAAALLGLVVAALALAPIDRRPAPSPVTEAQGAPTIAAQPESVEAPSQQPIEEPSPKRTLHRSRAPKKKTGFSGRNTLEDPYR